MGKNVIYHDCESITMFHSYIKYDVLTYRQSFRYEVFAFKNISDIQNLLIAIWIFGIIEQMLLNNDIL